MQNLNYAVDIHWKFAKARCADEMKDALRKAFATKLLGAAIDSQVSESNSQRGNYGLPPAIPGPGRPD